MNTVRPRRRSRMATIAVVATCAIYVGKALWAVVHYGQLLMVQAITPWDVAQTVGVPVVTVAAYILVVKEAPSILRWMWTAIVTLALGVHLWLALVEPVTGWFYDWTMVVAIFGVFVVLCGPLVWFYAVNPWRR